MGKKTAKIQFLFLKMSLSKISYLATLVLDCKCLNSCNKGRTITVHFMQCTWRAQFNCPKQLNNALNLHKTTNGRAKSQKYGR